MQAGKLDRRVQLQRATITRNAMNEPEETWATFATVWAQRLDGPGDERFRASEVAATATHRFRIRWASAWRDLNAKDRLICEGLTYDIADVQEIGRREGLMVAAIARAEARR